MQWKDGASRADSQAKDRRFKNRRKGWIWDYPYPRAASYSVLSYVLERKGVLRDEQFRVHFLICHNCPKPHDVGLVFIRGDRWISPWKLYCAGSAGAA